MRAAGNKSNNKHGKCQCVIIQCRIYKISSEKMNIVCGCFVISISGDGFIISRKNGRGDDKIIHGVGPIVHGPTVNDFLEAVCMVSSLIIKNNDLRGQRIRIPLCTSCFHFVRFVTINTWSQRTLRSTTDTSVEGLQIK